MGYVVDTQSSVWVPPAGMSYSAGTWTPTLATNVVTNNRTAGAAAFNLFVPIRIPGHEVNLMGYKLKSIDLEWTNGTADLTSVTTVELEKMVFPADTVAPTGAAVATTIDSGNDTTAKRITQAAHTMTVTVTVPEWVRNTAEYCLYVTFDCAAGSVVKILGARINYDIRL